MVKKGTSTFQDLVAELERDPEYRKVSRRNKPYYDLLLEIIRHRKRLGITQEELAERADTHQSCISRIESGEHDIRLSTLIEVAEALETRVEIKLVPIYYIADEAYRDLIRIAQADTRDAERPTANLISPETVKV